LWEWAFRFLLLNMEVGWGMGGMTMALCRWTGT